MIKNKKQNIVLTGSVKPIKLRLKYTGCFDLHASFLWDSSSSFWFLCLFWFWCLMLVGLQQHQALIPGPKAFPSCSKDWNKQPVSILTQSKLNSFLWHRVWTDLRQIRDVPSVNTHLLQQKRRAVCLLANVVTNRSFTDQQLVWLLSALHHLPLQLWGTRRFLSFLWGISCRYQVPLCTGLSSCQNIFLSSTKCKVTVMIFSSLFWILF